MPRVAFQSALRGVSFFLAMSTLLTFRSRLASALFVTKATIFVRHPTPVLVQNFQRNLSAITMLTKERVKAIMEGIPTKSSHMEKSTTDQGARDWSHPPLDVSTIRNMKTSELRMELSLRGLSTKGDRVMLIHQLVKSISETETDDSHDDALNEPPTIDPKQLYILRAKGHTTINSGGLGVGLALHDSNTEEKLWCGRMYVAGDRTVFEAEYTAVILGMQYAFQLLGIRRLLVQTSCDIIVQQIRGVYKVNKQSLRMLLEREQELEQIFDDFFIEDIPSTENDLCRDLAIKALATRKSVNVQLDERGNINLSDPIELLNRVPSVDGRWRQPDPPSFSAHIDPSRPYLLRFDGGSRGNPGVAGAGMVIYDDSGHEIWAGWKFHHEAATNNLAEYLGLLCGLKCARSLGIERLIVEGDSQLIVRQLTGKYQCREASLKKFFNAAQEVAKDFKYFEIRHIPRAENKRADWLANHAMDVSVSFGVRLDCCWYYLFRRTYHEGIFFFPSHSLSVPMSGVVISSWKNLEVLIKFKRTYDVLQLSYVVNEVLK